MILIVRQFLNSVSIVMNCLADTGSCLPTAAKNNRIFIDIDKSKITSEIEEQNSQESELLNR